MTTNNPIIISDLEEHVQDPAKDSSELANSSDAATRNEEIASFTKPVATSKKNQIKAKNWFLTFPQTTTTKEEASERLRTQPYLMKMGIKGYLIAQETHKDNNHHLHIALWMNKQLQITPKFFDFVCK